MIKAFEFQVDGDNNWYEIWARGSIVGRDLLHKFSDYTENNSYTESRMDLLTNVKFRLLKFVQKECRFNNGVLMTPIAKHGPFEEIGAKQILAVRAVYGS